VNKREIIQKLIELLSSELNVFNFNAATKSQGFIRRDKSATYFFYFMIYNRTNIKTGAKGFQVEPYAELSIPEIEKYYKEITINKELKTEWNFITLGNSIANLQANPDGINKKRNESLDLFLFDESQIRPVAEELLKQFKKVALPYFISNNTVNKVDELLNKNPNEYCVHIYNDLYRFIKGAIAAKLNNNPGFEQILVTYENLIVKGDMPDDCKEEMARLNSILPMIGKNIYI